MTTGRINQVAFLRDAARRAAPDPPGEGASADAGADVVQANRCLGRTLGEIAPRVHRMDCIREHGASSHAIGTERAHRLPWNARTANGSSNNPTRGSSDGTGKHRARESRLTGIQHRNHRYVHPTPGGVGMGMRRIACSPFGARARSQPAQTIRSPLTRPRVRKAQHHQTNHPPARLAACRQMETPGGAVPAPLGMTNQSYPSKGRERTRAPSRPPSIALAIAPHRQARDARSWCAGCVQPGLCWGVARVVYSRSGRVAAGRIPVHGALPRPHEGVHKDLPGREVPFSCWHPGRYKAPPIYAKTVLGSLAGKIPLFCEVHMAFWGP